MKAENVILDKSFAFALRILKEGELIEKKLAESFLFDCKEILKILTAILNSSKGGTK